MNKLTNISKVEVQDQIANVQSMDMDEKNQVIRLSVDKVISYDENGGNQIHIIRK